MNWQRRSVVVLVLCLLWLVAGCRWEGQVTVMPPAGTATSPAVPPTATTPPTNTPAPTLTATALPTPAPTATATATEAPAGMWQQLAPMDVARSEMPAVYLDGRIYVPGGFGNSAGGIFQGSAALEAYDVASGEWLRLADMPETRHHLMAAAHEGALYVFGGSGGLGESRGWNAWRYDPAEDSWTMLADMPEERVAGAAVALGDYLYVAGGTGGTAELLRYDPAGDTWTRLAPMRNQREHTAAVVLDGQIVVLGGRWTGAMNSVESYDPATDQWMARTGMRQRRAGFGATVLGGKIYVAGGELIEGAPVALNSVEVFDPAGGGWQVQEWTLPVPLHGVPLVAVEDALYVVGGSGVAGGVANRGDLYVVFPGGE